MRSAFRKAGAIVTVIAFSLSAAASADPLSPGKPAGVRAAQLGDKELLVFGGIGVVLAAVLIANNGSGEHAPIANTTMTVVSPTTT